MDGRIEANGEPRQSPLSSGELWKRVLTWDDAVWLLIVVWLLVVDCCIIVYRMYLTNENGNVMSLNWNKIGKILISYNSIKLLYKDADFLPSLRNLKKKLYL